MGNGLPNISIVFQSAAVASIARLSKGVIGVIVRDAQAQGAHSITSAAAIPAELGQSNRDYIARTFLGYVTPPRRVLLYVLPAEAADLAEALAYFAGQIFDYLVGPPDISTAECAEVATWVKSERLINKAICKAVLPDTASDHEAIINFTTHDIVVGAGNDEKTYSAAEYCSRMAGLLGGTPVTISSTFAPLPEVTSVPHMDRAEGDNAVNRGELILIHDGRQTKIGRGVNSLVTLTETLGPPFQKIKIVEIVDTIQHDINAAIEDGYTGKRSNSYDNKLVLLIAIAAYLAVMEADGILAAGANMVDIDVDAQELYLKNIGTDTSKMSEQQIREANTGSHVFMHGSLSILDAMEDVKVVFKI